MSKKADKEATNGFDPKKAVEFAIRIENVQSEIDEHMAEAREACSPLREDMDAIKEEANKEHNVPRAELNAILRKRRLERAAAAVGNKLNADQRANFEAIEAAFGDFGTTELGKATLEKAKTEGALAH